MKTTAKTMSNDLMKIPPELRNEIYELALTRTDDDYYDIELTETKPPSKNLLLTCREVYQEAKGIYQQAHRSFWQDSCFIIEDAFSIPNTIEGLKQILKDHDLCHVKDLTIYDGDGGKMVFANGVWTEYGPEMENGDNLELIIEFPEMQRLQDMPETVGFGMTPHGDKGLSWVIHLAHGLNQEDLAKFREAAKQKRLGVAELLGAVEYCKAR